jgi:hypothetical protein
MFGWDLPPGVTQRMIDEQAGDELCEVCGEYPDDCKCPECPTCGEYGCPTHSPGKEKVAALAAKQIAAQEAHYTHPKHEGMCDMRNPECKKYIDAQIEADLI